MVVRRRFSVVTALHCGFKQTIQIQKMCKNVKLLEKVTISVKKHRIKSFVASMAVRIKPTKY